MKLITDVRRLMVRELLGIRVSAWLLILLATCVLAVGAYFVTDLLPPTVSRYLPFAKWAAVVVGLSISAGAALQSYRQQSERAGRLAVVGAMIAIVGGSLDVPQKVNTEEYKALMERNAYPDLETSARLTKIAQRIDRTETNPSRLAQGKLGMQEYREAIRLLDLVMDDMQPAVTEFATASFYKATAHLKMDSTTAALREVDLALQLKPDYVEALVLKCNILRRADSLSVALDMCSRAIELDPRNALAWYQRGAVLWRMDKDQDALSAFEIAIRSNPRDPAPWNGKALAHWDLNDRLAALAAADTALRLRRGYLPALMTKASILRELRRYREAEPIYNQMLSANPEDAEIWINYGNMLFEADKKEESLGAFLSAIQLKPRCENAYYNMGDKLILMERYQQAVEYLEPAVRMEPRDSDAWQRLGDAYQALGRGRDAERAYSRARSINPEYISELSPEGYEC